MGKDLTPRELLAYERAVTSSGGPSILDSMRDVTVSINGKEFPYRTVEETAHRERFPLLGKLLNNFEPLYSELVSIPGGLDLLAQKEKDLQSYVETGQGDHKSPIILWFEGKLDESFYYSDTNESRFLACVRNEASALAIPDIHKLAADIDYFAFHFDTYEYKDRVEDREQHVSEIEEQIRSGQTSALSKYLFEFLEDTEYFDDEAIAARGLIARLEKANEKPALDEIISGAENHRSISPAVDNPEVDRDRYPNLKEDSCLDEPKFLVCGNHTFEVIDYIPDGYEFWNIGKNMTDGYLPLCKLSAVQPSSGAHRIDVDSLKAIKLGGAQTVLAASVHGQTTIEAMEKYLKRYQGKKVGTSVQRQINRIEAALNVLKDVKRSPDLSKASAEQEQVPEIKNVFGNSFDINKKLSLSDQIQSATVRSAGSQSAPYVKANEPEREI